MEPLAALSLAWTLLLLGVVFQMMNRQVLEGTLHNNGAFGIRTRATRSSDAAWQAGHLAAVPMVEISYRLAYGWFALVLVLAVVMQATVDESFIPFILALVGIGVVVGISLWAAVQANRAAKRVRDAEL